MVIGRVLAVAVLAGCANPTWKNLEERSSDEFGDPSWIDERALRTSIDLAAEHLVSQQRPGGLFRYQYDVVRGEESSDDNVVRQLGSYWALALLLGDREAKLSPDLRRRVKTAFDRMSRWIRERRRPYEPKPGAAWIALGGRKVPNGAIALCALALIERVRAGERAEEPLLREILAYLAASQMPSGGFADHYYPRERRFGRASNPYADGEILLAFAKYYNEIDGRAYEAVLPRAMPALRNQWFASREVDRKKGFYQWGTMAFWQYSRSHPAARRRYEDAILRYADWMVLEHRTLGRTRNTSYAVEGLATAFQVARARGDRLRTRGLRFTILKTHARLISAQIGHPLTKKNPFIASIPRSHLPRERTHGGFLNGHEDPTLRIDVTQHAIHSMLLTLEHGIL